MNTYWSNYVQQTEELYQSRALKFNKANMHRWIEAMGLEDGMKILDVGCAGGVVCHRIKEALPNVKITGIDFDTGHIEYAKRKTVELSLDCNFISGDATNLPFEDNSFDVCYSHTVINFCEPNKFISEQRRVLKPNGKIIIMCVYNMNDKPEEWIPTERCEEKDLFDKVWNAASKNPKSEIKRYENRVEKYFEYLKMQGLRNISLDVVSTVNYAPDFDNTSREMALMQMNEDRLSELCSVEKAYKMAPEALTAAQYENLTKMINRRFDKVIEKYERGEKHWNFRIGTTLLISGVK